MPVSFDVHIPRLVFTRNAGLREQGSWLDWALSRGIRAVVLPFPSRFSRGITRRLEEEAVKRGFTVERGGWDLSIFAGRGIFMPGERRRMQDGRRRNDCNFCPTNPDVIACIRKNAARIFSLYKKTEVFHLWPDRGHEEHWCSCPACRAFSREDQSTMAASAAAAVLAKMHPGAGLFYYAPLTGEQGIKALPNMRGIQTLPGRKGAEEAGWFLAGGSDPAPRGDPTPGRSDPAPHI